MMQKIEIGKYLRGKPEAMPDGTYFDILDDTILLIMFISNPTEQEKDSFLNGETKFGLLAEDGLIFFLAKLGDMPFVDAPYNRHLSPDPVDTTRPGEGQGYSLTMILANAIDSKTEAIRVISLYNKFSNTLMDLVENQPHILRYEEMLMKKYDKYSISEEMYEVGIKEKEEEEEDDEVFIKRNKNNIGYFYTDGAEFQIKMNVDKVYCDDCNVLLGDESEITVIPFLNSAYCKDCGERILEDCRVTDRQELKHEKEKVKQYLKLFK